MSTSAAELAHFDAVAQAKLVADGEATPTELVDAAIERIEAVNPQLNAVIIERFDQARAEAAADLPDGPLRGVPFLLKDIGDTQAGTPQHLGNRALKAAGHMSPGDTELGRRFRQAGLVTLGKTNLPELGTVPVTQPLAYGPTNNPWDLERSPSGSSGGAAAAVASGMVPVAHASDGGGSTRLPASWNGLVGLKTTRGRQPLPHDISRLLSELVVSRSVRDTAAVLDATHGHTSGCLYHLAPPSGPYTEEPGQELPPMRVGLLTSGGAEYEIHPEAVAAANLGAALLEELGHSIEVVSDEVLFGPESRVNGQLWMTRMRRSVASLGEAIGRPLTADEVEPYNWASAQRAEGVDPAEVFRAQTAQQVWSAKACEWMDQFDLLVTPTSGCPPMRTDELYPDTEKPWRIGRTYGLIGRFTLPFNATGHPAISLPLHWTDDGLPIGTQFVAGMGREDLLIRLGAQLEQVRPWAERRPNIWAG